MKWRKDNDLEWLEQLNFMKEVWLEDGMSWRASAELWQYENRYDNHNETTFDDYNLMLTVTIVIAFIDGFNKSIGISNTLSLVLTGIPVYRIRLSTLFVPFPKFGTKKAIITRERVRLICWQQMDHLKLTVPARNPVPAWPREATTGKKATRKLTYFKWCPKGSPQACR